MCKSLDDYSLSLYIHTSYCASLHVYISEIHVHIPVNVYMYMVMVRCVLCVHGEVCIMCTW